MTHLWLQDFLPVFASISQKFCSEERDWERFLLEEEFKYQDVPHAQVFDCTGISFGFFDDDSQEVSNQLHSGAGLEEAVEILDDAASLRLSSFCSINGTRQDFLPAVSTLLDVSDFSPVFMEDSPDISSTAPNTDLPTKAGLDVPSANENSVQKQCEPLEDIKISCLSRSECDVMKDPETNDAEQCISAMLDEICVKLAECWAAQTPIRVPDGEESQLADLNPLAGTLGSGGVGEDFLKRTLPSGSTECLFDPQRSTVELKDEDTELSEEKTVTNSSITCEEVAPLKDESNGEHFLVVGFSAFFIISKVFN